MFTKFPVKDKASALADFPGPLVALKVQSPTQQNPAEVPVAVEWCSLTVIFAVQFESPITVASSVPLNWTPRNA